MTIDVAIADWIADLNTSAGARVYMLKLPQKLGTWPAVRVQGISSPRPQHLRGPNYPVKTRVQVDGFAPEASGTDPFATVSDLMEEIRGDGLGPDASGLFGWIGELGGSPPAFRILNVDLDAGKPKYESGQQNELDLRLVRIMDEYTIHWTPM